jgi:NAD-dependent DNA ligase
MSEGFAKSAAINHHNLAKAAQVLIGICSGIAADNTINDNEILFLRQWIAEHAEVAAVWPGSMIAKRIDEILEDGIITPDERADLLHILQEMSGNFFADTGVAQQLASTLPIDHDAVLAFAGKTICFTGTFLFGSRAVCQETATQQGGIPEDTITKRLDYLVIGAMASPDWVNTTYGRKIEKAVGYRAEHGRPLIISEQQWAQYNAK